jgi:RNA polymerase sigma-70 factor (ECF subfamily)
VALNRAVALAEIDGPQAGLAAVDDLPLADYRFFHATRASFLERLGRGPEAVTAYRRALDLASNEAERGLLRTRLENLGDLSIS